MRPEGLSYWKIPVTPPIIEPATLRFVAQCLNQLRHHVPRPETGHRLNHGRRLEQDLDTNRVEDRISSLFCKTAYRPMITNELRFIWDQFQSQEQNVR